jgi:hypothetical protein
MISRTEDNPRGCRSVDLLAASPRSVDWIEPVSCNDDGRDCDRDQALAQRELPAGELTSLVGSDML